MQRDANVDNPRVVFLRECALADARQAQARSKAEGGDEDDFDAKLQLHLHTAGRPQRFLFGRLISEGHSNAAQSR
eukprot:30957-Pelagococcus_subviridis.AAC.26